MITFIIVVISALLIWGVVKELNNSEVTMVFKVGLYVVIVAWGGIFAIIFIAILEWKNLRKLVKRGGRLINEHIRVR